MGAPRAYIMKPIDDDELAEALVQTIRVVKEQRETRELRKRVRTTETSPSLLFREYPAQTGEIPKQAPGIKHYRKHKWRN
ncbi:hypothetical protein AGMMS49579_24680 [Spirochaetia bacterium]|nr:hypothetical protein AGMMS49579_24680 [Spirochaetia bacterium]